MNRRLANLIRRTISSPELYGLMRTAMVTGQKLLRRPDEPDLRLLARLPARDSELILDIGANGGQSAVALSFIRPAARIISFEPLPTLWPELTRVRRLIGPRFELRRYGLGAAPATVPIFIPVVGRLPITTRASVLEEEARGQLPGLARDSGLETSLLEVEIEIRRGDDENLAPLAIKIDVEGAERAVLDGLAGTIDTHRPTLLLERGTSFDTCREFFRERDYTIFVGDPETPDTHHCPDLSSRNWIAAPGEVGGVFGGAIGEAVKRS